jgi:hypothetical protein
LVQPHKPTIVPEKPNLPSTEPAPAKVLATVNGKQITDGGRSPTNPTTISYSQLGVCKVWTTPAGNVEKAKTDEGFAVFKIETIDNTKPSDSFNLDPERLYVDQTKAEMKAKIYLFRFVDLLIRIRDLRRPWA